jgi:hypothetical protein
VAVALAVLSLIGDVVPEGLRWSVVLASLGLLVYRLTLVDSEVDVEAVLRSRLAYEEVTFPSRLRGARTVWIFGPSAVNLLSGTAANELHRTVLSRADGLLRVLVLDPGATDAVALASRQLDDGLDHPAKPLAAGLADTLDLLTTIETWRKQGDFEYRLAPLNPGFSILAIDPKEKQGVIIVEFHGCHNESTESRMHIELGRRSSEHWYEYWIDQFEALWEMSRRQHD